MKFDVVQEGPSWGIKHNGSYLGFAGSEQEAAALVSALEGADDTASPPNGCAPQPNPTQPAGSPHSHLLVLARTGDQRNRHSS